MKHEVDQTSSEQEDTKSQLWSWIGYGAVAAATVATFASGCTEGENSPNGEEAENKVIESMHDSPETGETETIQANVHPGMILVPSGEVNLREHPHIDNFSPSDPSDNKVEQQGDTRYIVFDRPFIAANQDGEFYIGAYPEDASEETDIQWTMLRTDVAENLVVLGEPESESVRYHGSEGLNTADEVNIYSNDKTSFTLKDGRPVARMYEMKEGEVLNRISERGYAPLEVDIDSFPESWEQK